MAELLAQTVDRASDAGQRKQLATLELHVLEPWEAQLDKLDPELRDA